MTARADAGRVTPACRRTATRLEVWYGEHRRDLPWRGAAEPYAIWVSEVMLQQTRVATALPYFERWMRAFPDVRALAAAAEPDVLRAWEGLGYYSRARRLHSSARALVERHGGELPRTAAALLELPGVGRYTAGAVASLAWGERVPAVDGNAVRVVARLDAIDARGGALLRAVEERAAELVRAASEPAALNQALMELGATVCAPREPRCGRCPLRGECRARAAGRPESLPRAAARPRPLRVHAVAALVVRGGRALVGRLAGDAPRWAGLWAFPTVEVAESETPEGATRRAAAACGARVEPGARASSVRHTITRHRITLDAFECRPVGASGPVRPPWVERRWLTPPELDALAMPAPHRRLAAAVQARLERAARGPRPRRLSRG